MALPQKAIEQLGREPVKTPGWSARILMISSTVFFLSFATYFGIRFGYQPYQNSQLKKIQNQIEAFAQKIPQTDQEKLINFYSQIYNLDQLLRKEKFASAVLPWLEANTQANTYFTSFSLDLGGPKISVSARSRTVDDVAQQLVSLEENKDIKSLTFNGVTPSEDGFWNYNLQLTFVPEFFGKPDDVLNKTPSP